MPISASRVATLLCLISLIWALPESPGTAWADSQTPAATAPVPTTAPATPAPAAAPAPPSDLVVPAMNIHLKGFVDVYAQYNPTSAGTTD
ncbi:MAG: hypothetical protein M0Z25_11015, partial [Nitrospiraceae bacterium]|nr:hypothetical protein [Nitrospiraceae bacterium]